MSSRYARLIVLAIAVVSVPIFSQELLTQQEIADLRANPEQGSARAQFYLGVSYDTGDGVAEDDVEAVRWYRLAADQGDAFAQVSLGLMYDTGEGVPEDAVEAVRWYRLAAEQGFAVAQYNLGVSYDTGEGVAEDDVEAVRWFRLAAEQGDVDAQYELSRLSSRNPGSLLNVLTSRPLWSLAIIVTILWIIWRIRRSRREIMATETVFQVGETGGAGYASYYPVSVYKFVALSVLTFGLYQFYWFYKNWAFIRDRDHSDFTVWTRVIFAPYFCFQFLVDVSKRTPGASLTVLSWAYLALMLAGYLQSPFWMVSFFSFFPLLPVVRRINALNSAGIVDRNSVWKARHVLLALVGGTLIVVSALSELKVIPTNEVFSGASLPARALAYLENANISTPDERILYFFSNGTFSFADTGSVLTDRRVISYGYHPVTLEDRPLQSAEFDEILTVQVEKGNFMDLTIVTVTRRDGSVFEVGLTTEGQGDERFITALDERVLPLR